MMMKLLSHGDSNKKEFLNTSNSVRNLQFQNISHAGHPSNRFTLGGLAARYKGVDQRKSSQFEKLGGILEKPRNPNYDKKRVEFTLNDE
jgi:hypothetical protein